jgi:hypothetical protein
MTTPALLHRAQLAAQLGGASVLGQCTRHTVRCADARRYQAALRDCCRGHLRTIVTDAVAALREAGVLFWADYGTLLGAVRNPLTTWADYPWLYQTDRPPGPLAPGIIPHDKDADFGVLTAEWTTLLRVAAALTAQGYFVLVRPHQGSIKVCLSVTNRTNLDLFAWREHAILGHKPATMLRRAHYISVDQFKGRDFPKADLLPMASVEWEGLRLPAPRDPKAFCAFRYGDAWCTPLAANHDGKRRA